MAEYISLLYLDDESFEHFIVGTVEICTCPEKAFFFATCSLMVLFMCYQNSQRLPYVSISHSFGKWGIICRCMHNGLDKIVK